MTKRELKDKKQELCELRSQAIKDFKDFFISKKEELKEHSKEQDEESEDSEET